MRVAHLALVPIVKDNTITCSKLGYQGVLRHIVQPNIVDRTDLLYLVQPRICFLFASDLKRPCANGGCNALITTERVPAAH